jgi:hypothetical protein
MRPTRKWENNIQTYFRDTGYNGVNYTEVAQDKT